MGCAQASPRFHAWISTASSTTPAATQRRYRTRALVPVPRPIKSRPELGPAIAVGTQIKMPTTKTATESSKIGQARALRNVRR